jgi:hypothetical protein
MEERMSDSDSVDVLVVGSGRSGSMLALNTALRTLGKDDQDRFHPLSSVGVSSYFLVPEISELIGYPGHGRNPARDHEAFDQLSDGILDPVLECGPIYISANGE